MRMVFWIGTSRGLSRYQPRVVPLPEVPPTVVFTSVRFGGEEWNGDSTVEILTITAPCPCILRR